MIFSDDDLAQLWAELEKDDEIITDTSVINKDTEIDKEEKENDEETKTDKDTKRSGFSPILEQWTWGEVCLLDQYNL